MTSLRFTATALLIALTGCAREDPAAPPVVRYGDAVCVECNMILSDERFATATVVEDERGRPLTLLFDDFNCQARHEASHADRTILRRWVHDHGTRAWIAAESAHFVRSPALHTPMASSTAAFALREDAEETARGVQGVVLGFGAAWAALADTPCCHDESSEDE